LVDKLSKIDGIKRIRLSSIQLCEVGSSLISLIRNNQKLCHHLHIPLQSGDNYILKLMNRTYTVEEFADKVDRIKQHIADIGITTDVIVGFPKEEEQHFLNTVYWVKKIRFLKIHIFPFSQRPFIEANKLDVLVPGNVIKERVRKLRKVEVEIKRDIFSSYLGRSLCVLFEQRNKDGLYQGFSSNYIKVIAPDAKFNKFYNVKVTEVYDDFVKGAIN